LINGLLGQELSKNVVGIIGSLAVGLSFLVTVAIFLEFPEAPGRPEGGGEDVLYLDLRGTSSLGGLT